jgi:hypothetical protein
MGSIQTSVNQQKSVLRIQAIGSGFTDIQVDRVDDAHPKKVAYATIFRNTGICQLIFQRVELDPFHNE